MKEQLHNCNQCTETNEAGEKVAGEFCIRFLEGTRDVFRVLESGRAKHIFQVIHPIEDCEKRKLLIEA